MSRLTWESDEILHQFRSWLEETAAELEQLPEVSVLTPADSLVADSLVSDSLVADSLVADSVLADSVLADSVLADSRTRERTATDLPRIGLRQVVEAFTALRHETKLQTKSSRGLEETVHAALQGLDNASRQFQSVQAKEAEAAERAVRPYVDALVGLDESLWRAEKAFAASHRQMTQAAPRRLEIQLAEEFQRLPAWRRWLSRSWYDRAVRVCAEALAKTADDEFATLMQGFQLIRARLERTLRECGVERLQTVGQRADPARMTVIELVDAPDAPPETVVEEVRPGYAWKGVVVRFAEVRAARRGELTLSSADA